jgi:hypothetical protein
MFCLHNYINVSWREERSHHDISYVTDRRAEISLLTLSVLRRISWCIHIFHSTHLNDTKRKRRLQFAQDDGSCNVQLCRWEYCGVLRNLLLLRYQITYMPVLPKRLVVGMCPYALPLLAVGCRARADRRACLSLASHLVLCDLFTFFVILYNSVQWKMPTVNILSILF